MKRGSQIDKGKLRNWISAKDKKSAKKLHKRARRNFHKDHNNPHFKDNRYDGWEI